MFRKTSNKILLAALSVAAIGVTIAAVQSILQSPTPQLLQPSISPESAKNDTGPSVNNIGKEIADRLERECDYWDIKKYNPDGTVTVSKGIYMDWGRRWTMMIPRSSWDSLSASDRAALIGYVSVERYVSQIIVGEVVPSNRFEGNTMTVDKIVWP